MAKSQNTREFQTEDGRSVVFNQKKFHYEFNRKAEEIKRKSEKKRGEKGQLFRIIAERLMNSSDEDHIKDIIPRIKNWYYGKNGPGELEEIYVLADVLECEDREAFLKEKEKKMKVSSAEMVSVNFDHDRIIRAMRSMKEKEVAYELYSVFVDLMGSYLKADMDVWVEYEEGTPEWEAALANFPRRLRAECAIQKAKMYLSEDTIYGAYNLLETMYGPTVFEGEEPCDLKYDMNYLLSGFRHERLELYCEYLEQKGIKKEPGSNYRDDDWGEFMLDLNHHWWQMLEEVFEEYIP